MSTSSSIFERINRNVGAEGRLPRDFQIEGKGIEETIAFAPGAKDGISLYHQQGETLEEEGRQIADLFREYFLSEDKELLAKIENILAGKRALALLEPMLKSFSSDYKDIDLNWMIILILRFLRDSQNVEFIKLGISLLSLIDLGDADGIVEFLLTFALYDEFTLFVIFTVANWTGGNDLIFSSAKKVSGWGKIHAIESLKATNEEIRSWILQNGCANDVQDSYLALTAARKGELLLALQEDSLKSASFDGIAIIVDALIDEGPVPGISAFEQVEDMLFLYLKHAQKMAVDLVHLCHLLNLRDWLLENELADKENYLIFIGKIIAQDKWQDLIASALEGGDEEKRLLAASIKERLHK